MATLIYQVSSGSATAANDLGNVAVGVRNDALVQLNPTNLAYGFYAVDASGRMFVTGTLGVSASNLTAFVSNQPSAHLVDTLTTNLSGTLAFSDVVSVSGDFGINGAQNTLAMGAVNARGHRWIAGSILDASSYVASGTTGVVMMALASSTVLAYAGSAFRPFQVDLNGNLRITATAVWPVSAGSVFGVSGNLSAVTASQNSVVWGVTASAVTASQNGVTWGISASAVTAMVSGQNAHAATTAGNPVRIGLVAAKMGAAVPTAGDASGVNWYGTRYGQAFVLGGGPHVKFLEYDLTAATGFHQIVSGNTGEIIYVTEAGMHLAGSTTVNGSFRMVFASAHNATLISAPITATANITGMNENPIISVSACAPGGGIVRGAGGGIIASGADGCSIIVSATAPTNGRYRYWVTYYTVSG